MPTLPTHEGSWGRYTPPVGVQIQWAHPLAHGLIWYVLGHEAVPVELVSGNHGTVQNAVPFVTPIEGRMLRFSSSANTGLSFRLSRTVTAQPMSIATCVLSDSYATNIRFFMDHRASTGGVIYYAMNSGTTDAGVTNNLRAVRSGTSNRTGLHSSGTAGLVTGRPQSLAITWPRSDPSVAPSFYFDGQRDSAAVTSGGTATTGDAAIDGLTDVYLGRADSATPRNLDGGIAYMGIWRRTLSPSEVALLDADPYCFLVPA